MEESNYLQILWIEMLIHIPLFWIISLIMGLVLFIDCSQGHIWIAHYIFTAYLGLFVLTDIIIYLYRPEKRPKYKGKCISTIMNSELLQWILEETICFFAYIDMYTDICFIRIAVDTKVYKLWISSLILTVITYSPKIIFYIWIIRKKMKYNEWSPDAAKKASCAFEFKGAVYILNHIEFDSKIDNKYQLISNLWKFFSEDFGQFIIQLLYIIKVEEYCPDGGVNQIIYVSLAITIIVGFYSIGKPIYQKCKTDSLISEEFKFPIVDLSHKKLNIKAISKILKTNTITMELNLGINYT